MMFSEGESNIAGGFLFCVEMGDISECLFDGNDTRQGEALTIKKRAIIGRMKEGMEEECS